MPWSTACWARGSQKWLLPVPGENQQPCIATPTVIPVPDVVENAGLRIATRSDRTRRVRKKTYGSRENTVIGHRGDLREPDLLDPATRTATPATRTARP